MLSIREMRSSLKSQSEIASYHGAPDWAIRHIYETRNGMPLSKVGRPANMSRAELRSRYATRSTLPSAASVSNDERERMARQLALANL